MVSLKILHVDLSSKTTKEEVIDDQTVRKFIGGVGLGTKILLEKTKKGVEPLSEDNLLIIMTGPATGTIVPLSGRYHVITKSPLTNAIGDADSGGNFGPMLRFAGYDGIVFYKASGNPTYITIMDENEDGKPEVSFKDASNLWGKGVYYTEEKIREELQVGSVGSILSIGPAGENLSLISAIMNDENRAAGRCGVGAVMGSKNLKAIYVKPFTRPKVHDEEGLKKVVEEKEKKLAENDVTGKALPTYGTEVVTNVMNKLGCYPTKNFQTGHFPTADKISGETLRDTYLKGTKGCWGCTVKCARLVKIDEPPYQVDYEGAEYEGVWAMGGDCGIDDLKAVNKAYTITNDMGLDVISYGATVACAMELYEKGKIPEEKLHGLKLNFGNPQAVIDLAWMTGYRNGLGDDIADGAKRLAEKYGMPEVAMHVKGLELPAYDPRGLQGHGLGYATSNRGGCHLRAYMPAYEAFGVPFKVDPYTTEGKAKLVIDMQNYFAATVDSLVTCKFTTFALSIDDYVDLIRPLTGWDITTEELAKTGERIYNIERVFNVREGVIEDTLPDRLVKEPMPEGPAKGMVVKLDEMLKEYYKLRGWVDGVPTKEKLKELGIEQYL
jgi:aldehyde:ferredoxin oxidoreductase